MICHKCRKDHPWLLFGRYCLPCYRRHAPAELADATWHFRHANPTPYQVAASRGGMAAKELAHERPPGKGSLVPRAERPGPP